MTGQLFMVVGPSGVGKDTLIDAALLECKHVTRVRRVVTRATDAGGEDITSVTQQKFDEMNARGDFAFSWQAHGLSYGVPSSIHAMLEYKLSVLFNGSRKMIDQAVEAFPDLIILSIEADQDVLRNRLLARGRETTQDIERRLQRASLPVPDAPNVRRILNNGSLEQATQYMIKVLNHEGQNVQ